ncbi:gentamicin 3'-acetyltransferase [alpha proteobacterium AAP81b]|nr:gentamicin 3'-acetyltransferase [alpha proteobacterium AAP81b]
MTKDSSIPVQRLGAGDSDRLRAINALFGEAFEDPEHYGDAPPCDAHLRRLLASDSFIALAASVDGRVVGGLTAYDLVKAEAETSEIYLYDIAVAADFRRRGIATALIDALRGIARDRGAGVIFVQADRDDPPAIALYTGLGTRADVHHFDIAP